MSGNLPFVQSYAMQLTILTNGTTALGIYFVLGLGFMMFNLAFNNISVV
jgi:hypothetical protein